MRVNRFILDDFTYATVGIAVVNDNGNNAIIADHIGIHASNPN